MPRGSKAAAKAKAISGPAGGEAVATNPSPNPPTPEAPAGYHAGPMGDGGEGETMVTTEPAGPLAPGTGSDLSVCRGSWMVPGAESAQYTNHVAAVQHAFRFNHHITVSGLHLLLKAITGASPPDNTKSADLRNMLVQAVSEKLFMEWRLATAAGGAAVGNPGLSEGPTAAAPTDDSGDESGETPEGSEDDDLDIVVKLPSGVMFVATMDESDLVMDLKDKIMNHKDYEILDKDIRIIYKGRQLADGCRLMDYNMQDCAKVHVVYNTTGGGKQTIKVKPVITKEQKLANMVSKYRQKHVNANMPFARIIKQCLDLLNGMNEEKENINATVRGLDLEQLQALVKHLEEVPKTGLRGEERLQRLFPILYPFVQELSEGISQLMLINHNLYQAFYSTYAKAYHNASLNTDNDEASFDHVSFKKFVDEHYTHTTALRLAQQMFRNMQSPPPGAHGSPSSGAHGAPPNFSEAVDQLATYAAGLHITPLTPGAPTRLPEDVPMPDAEGRR
jgi:hypothetical protein